jgi:RecA-family ATPase
MKSIMVKYTELPREETIYIGGMFPVGKVSAVVANGGVGKSWCVLLASLSITKGVRFLPNEEYPVWNDKDVMVIDTENRAKTFCERVILAGGSLERYYVPGEDICSAITYFDKRDKESIEEEIQDPNTMMVIVDSLAGFNGGIDENTVAASESIKWLGRLAQKYNKAVVLTHFLNKSEVTNRINTENMRGHSSCQQYMELIWAIDKDKGSEKIKRLYQIKNNITEIDDTVYRFKLTEASAEFLVTPTAEETSLKEKRAKIFEANIDKSDKEIAELILIEEPTSYLHNLVAWVKRRRKG